MTPGDLAKALSRAARIRDLGDDEAFLATELASWPQDLDDADRRALALLTLCVIATHRRGSTRVPLGDEADGFFARELEALASAAGWKDAPADLCRRALAVCGRREPGWPIGGANDPTPLCASDGFIASHRMVACEDRVAIALKTRLDEKRGADPADVDAALADVIARPAGVSLSDEQTAAIKGACTGHLAIISGGPGTGKTAIAAAIVRVLARLGIAPDAIALAAPTGKAAQRMATSLNAQLGAIDAPAAADTALTANPPKPRTLHRLLGYMPDSGRFRYRDGRPLSKEAILVDEASMVDAELMDALLRALPDTARLIFLGDADQLPSVDAGAVFRDLAQAARGSGIAFHLERSYRMRESDPEGRQILSAAAHIQRGEAEPILTGKAAVRCAPAALAWSGIELAQATGSDDAPQTARAVIDRFYADHIASDDLRALSRRTFLADGNQVCPDDAAVLATHIERTSRSQILAATRRLPGGAIEISRHLRALHRADVGLRPRAPLCPGEPILITRNDHDRDLLNGDCGVCATVVFDRRKVPCAILVKGDRVLAYPIESLADHVESAFAITIHKSQGSEYDHVAVMLPPTDVPLCTRELLYTAITRARKSAALVGPEAVIRAAIERRAERFSGVADKVMLTAS